MKKFIVFLLVTSISVLSGCASSGGKTLGDAAFTWKKGGYWAADPTLSIAANAMALGGSKEKFKDRDTPKANSTSNRDVTIGAGGGYMSNGMGVGVALNLLSLFGDVKTDYLDSPNIVVFVDNPNNLPIDSPVLARTGAEAIYQALGTKLNTPLNECVIKPHSMDDWNSCLYAGNHHLTNLYSDKNNYYYFKPIRPATGNELPQLNLPIGNYAVIRYSGIPLTYNERGYVNTIIPQGYIYHNVIKDRAYGTETVLINSKSYYFLTGSAGQTGY